MAGTPLPIDGLLIVDKPPGWTSHDVVARLRRLTGVRRIGHAGTLDPLATGVLPLGIGQGTRVLEYVSDAEKTYVATVRLGITTDTYDADGTVLETRDCGAVTADQIRAMLAGFVGEIEQRPPAYSAIKQGGVPLYRLARAGRAVEAPPRRVTIFAIEEIRFEPPRVDFSVRCSKGTYIRSLAHDLGERLGCGAHLAALRRTATGGFTLAQAVTLERFAIALGDGSWPLHVLPLDAPLLHDAAVILADRSARWFADGVAPPRPAALPPDRIVRAYGPDGLLLGLLRPAGVEAGWRVEKVFQGPSPAGADAEDP
jgi:tRNA pseudouridine55 synthase